MAKLSYGPKTIALDQLKIGEASGVTMEGAGSFDRASATGKLALNASTASFAQFTALVAPVAPVVAARLNAMAARPGPARLKLSLDLDKNPDHAERANARAVFDIDAPGFKGVTTITATPVIAAIRDVDSDALARSEIGIEFEIVVGAGAFSADIAGARPRDIGRRRSGAVRGVGDGGVARAVAAESQAVGH